MTKSNSGPNHPQIAQQTKGQIVEALDFPPSSSVEPGWTRSRYVPVATHRGRALKRGGTGAGEDASLAPLTRGMLVS